jgi:hypothetical protein
LGLLLLAPALSCGSASGCAWPAGVCIAPSCAKRRQALLTMR